MFGNRDRRQEPTTAGGPLPDFPADFEEKISRVLPSEEENGFLRIKWLVNLNDAVREASRTGKPLYLWLMNGHPLGFT